MQETTARAEVCHAPPAGITAIILTFNEEIHIARCLSRIMPLVERVVVIDSFSTDRTVEIASQLGAEVLQREFKHHRPLSRDAVGEDFERFDLVFIGAFEHERMNSINALCEGGLRVVVYGGSLGRWDRGTDIHPSLVVREACFGEQYTKTPPSRQSRALLPPQAQPRSHHTANHGNRRDRPGDVGGEDR